MAGPISLQTHRLTPAIRRAFVLTLRTPALLAMFSKDPLSMGLAQGALRSLAFLEPALVMPDLLERAYSGLEVVNETHRTTAVLSMVSGVSLPLSSETIWLGGQKHILPLLEMCIPGIDLVANCRDCNGSTTDAHIRRMTPPKRFARPCSSLRLFRT